MGPIGTVYRRLVTLLRRKQLEQDLDDELAFHLEMREQDQARDAWTFAWVESMLQDIRFAIRGFRRSPGFTLAAVTTLALGIGINVAIFSVVNTVLLTQLPYADPDRLVVFGTKFPAGPNFVTSEQKFNLWREQTSVAQDVAGYRYSLVNLTGVEAPEQIQAAWVTADYFRLLGLPLARGRAFTPDEVRPQGPLVAVVSDGLWKRVFGADPQVIGRTISLNDSLYDVIGIVAEGVDTTAPRAIDVWVPLAVPSNSTRQVHYFSALGRLRPGITLEAANARLAVVADEFRRAHPNAAAMGPQATFIVQPMREAMVGEVRTSLLILAGAVTFVLLIACVNVANLLLARSAARRREMGIRAAIGAGRGRIVRQLLTESLLLSAIGGALGLMLGWSGVRALLALNPGNVPRIGEYGSAVAMDWRVVTFTVVVSFAAGMVFGLWPTLHAARHDLNTVLKGGVDSFGKTVRRHRASSVLVVSEMALALVLLIGAALLMRSFVALRTVDPGIDAQNVLTLRISLSGPRFEKTSAVAQFIEDAVRRIEAVPGVERAAYSSYLPMEGSAVYPFIVDGRPLNAPSHGFGPWTSVSVGYFDVFRIPLVRGRSFTEGDAGGAPGVVIINQAMARRGWPDSDPLNDRIFIGRGSGPEFEEPARQIVGIVGDVHDGPLSRDPQPAMYVPAAQLTDGLNARTVQGSMAWIVRTTLPPVSIAEAVQQQLRLASGGLPVGRTRLMAEVTAQSTARADFNTQLFATFGLSALVLAAIGIYGLVGYSVQQRMKDIGVRLALGADRSAIRNSIVFQGMRLAAIGTVIGVISALGVAQLIAGFLFRVQPRDPMVFVAASIVLAAVALVAVWLPACRAANVDPLVALRCE
jgi:putative ABC transport system permease protein